MARTRRVVIGAIQNRFGFLVLAIMCLSTSIVVEQKTSASPVVTISAQYKSVYCFTKDTYNDNSFYICTENSVVKFHYPNSFFPIAGVHNISGYKEGCGNEARFSKVKDILQLNKTSILATDYGNHCVRIITGRTTSAFAGVCQTQGMTNGTRLTALFTKPVGLLQRNMVIPGYGTTPISLLFITHEFNQVRSLVLNYGIVVILPILSEPFLSENLGYLDCFASCSKIYYLTRTGVAVYMSNGVSNELQTNSSLDNPMDLLQLDERGLLVADTGNGRILVIKLSDNGISGQAYPIMLTGVDDPFSLALLNDILIIGSSSGIHSTNSSEYLIAIEHNLTVVDTEMIRNEPEFTDCLTTSGETEEQWTVALTEQTSSITEQRHYTTDERRNIAKQSLYTTKQLRSLYTTKQSRLVTTDRRKFVMDSSTSKNKNEGIDKTKEPLFITLVCLLVFFILILIVMTIIYCKKFCNSTPIPSTAEKPNNAPPVKPL